MKTKKILSAILSLLVVFVTALPAGAMKPTGDAKYNAADINGSYNNVTDWQRVKSSLDGIYIKATEGVTYTGERLAEYSAGAQSVGLATGYYQFFWPWAGSNGPFKARQEADSFWRTVKGYKQQLIPMVDVEEVNGCSAQEITADVGAFCDELIRVDHAPGVIIYASTSFINSYLGTVLNRYPLWIAHYDVAEPGNTDVWGNWTIWQYTDSGSVQGIDGSVDLNHATAGMFISQSNAPVTSTQTVTKPAAALLQTGDTGNAVTTLQSNLNQLGYDLLTDGIFGRRTYAAVIDFQRSHGLDDDGIVGQLTQDAIATAINDGTSVSSVQRKLNRLGYGLSVDGSQGPRTTTAIESFESVCGISVDGEYGPQCDSTYQSIVNKPTLSIGSSGTAVRWVQHISGASIDGIFGRNTYRAVKSYQDAHGLSADGIVGYHTWGDMIGG